MSTQNVFMIAVFLAFLYGIYQTRILRTRLKCHYTSRSKQTYDKMVKSTSAYVIFEGKKFYIMPSCVKHHWYEKGISSLFPTFMPEIDFTWESPYPVDPNTGKPTMLTPEVEKLLDQEGAMADYAGSQQKAVMGKSKLGGLDKWLPWIALAGVALIGVFVYTMYKDQSTMKTFMSDIYNQVQKIAPK